MSDTDSSVTVSVRDNGIGIDADYGERIFKMFQRLQNRSEYVGTGLGLGICRRIVANHGGTISMVSNGGEGTEFRFTL